MLSILDITSMCVGYVCPIREGGEYYKSGLLFGVGLLEKTGTMYKCQGLAVQTSAVSGKPHEIDIKFDTSNVEGEPILEMKCSCIAAQCGKCKHGIATILWLTRHEEEDLADVSCTDVEQQWGKMKSSTKPQLEACLLTELCHVKEQSDVYGAQIPEVTEEMKEKWKNILLKCKFKPEGHLR